MKNLLLTVLSIVAIARAAFAGSFGPGPWANGAYYQGQFDGTYSATVYGQPGVTNDPVLGSVYTGTVVSGVVGFQLKDGHPVGITNDVTALGVLDRNFYAIFANGETFIGPTFANININKKTVAGAFGADTNSATATFLGGGFIADIDSHNALFTFSGDGLINTDLAPLPGAPTTPSSGVEFEIYGIKTGN